MPVTKLDSGVSLDAPVSQFGGGNVTRLPENATVDPPPAAASAGSLPWYSRFLHGVADPLVGLGQLAAHAGIVPVGEEPPLIGAPGPPPATSAEIDMAVRQRETSYQGQRQAAGQSGTDYARLAGEIASPINYAVPAVGAETALGRVGLAAASGAFSGASEPVTEGDYWSRKLGQVAGGAVSGGAVGGAAAGLGKAIAPTMSAAAKRLADAGVSLTPGQMGAGGGIVGRQVRRAEEAFKSFPVFGNFIRGAEGRSIESFNRATINQALDPIGSALPKGMMAGHDAVDYAAKAISAEYDKLLPTMSFHADAGFHKAMADLKNAAAEMPPPQAQQLDGILNNRLVKRMPSGTMDGSTVKQVESELGHFGASYRGSPDAAQRQLGEAIDDVRSAIKDALIRQNPAQAGKLADINSSYAMLVRVERAASRRPGSEGMFTPMDLLSAVKTGDRSSRKRAFAHGDALLQDWAEAAQKVLPAKMPDSGTTERAAYLGLGGGLVAGGEHFLGSPGGLTALGALGAGSLPYTRIGGAAVQRLATPGVARKAAGKAVSDFGLYASPAAAMFGELP